MAWASLKPARDPEDPFSGHQNAIEEMVQEGHTDDEIVAGHFDRRRPTDGSLSPTHQKAGARRTYKVTLLWLPPRPEDSILDLVSGLPSERLVGGLGSFD